MTNHPFTYYPSSGHNTLSTTTTTTDTTTNTTNNTTNPINNTNTITSDTSSSPPSPLLLSSITNDLGVENVTFIQQEELDYSYIHQVISHDTSLILNPPLAPSSSSFLPSNPTLNKDTLFPFIDVAQFTSSTTHNTKDNTDPPPLCAPLVTNSNPNPSTSFIPSSITLRTPSIPTITPVTSTQNDLLAIQPSHPTSSSSTSFIPTSNPYAPTCSLTPSSSSSLSSNFLHLLSSPDHPSPPSHPHLAFCPSASLPTPSILSQTDPSTSSNASKSATISTPSSSSSSSSSPHFTSPSTFIPLVIADPHPDLISFSPSSTSSSYTSSPPMHFKFPTPSSSSSSSSSSTITSSSPLPPLPASPILPFLATNADLSSISLASTSSAFSTTSPSSTSSLSNSPSPLVSSSSSSSFSSTLASHPSSSFLSMDPDDHLWAPLPIKPSMSPSSSHFTALGSMGAFLPTNTVSSTSTTIDSGAPITTSFIPPSPSLPPMLLATSPSFLCHPRPRTVSTSSTSSSSLSSAFLANLTKPMPFTTTANTTTTASTSGSRSNSNSHTVHAPPTLLTPLSSTSTLHASSLLADCSDSQKSSLTFSASSSSSPSPALLHSTEDTLHPTLLSMDALSVPLVSTFSGSFNTSPLPATVPPTTSTTTTSNVIPIAVMSHQNRNSSTGYGYNSATSSSKKSMTGSDLSLCSPTITTSDFIHLNESTTSNSTMNSTDTTTTTATTTTNTNNTSSNRSQSSGSSQATIHDSELQFHSSLFMHNVSSSMMEKMEEAMKKSLSASSTSFSNLDPMPTPLLFKDPSSSASSTTLTFSEPCLASNALPTHGSNTNNSNCSGSSSGKSENSSISMTSSTMSAQSLPSFSSLSSSSSSSSASVASIFSSPRPSTSFSLNAFSSRTSWCKWQKRWKRRLKRKVKTKAKFNPNLKSFLFPLSFSFSSSSLTSHTTPTLFSSSVSKKSMKKQIRTFMKKHSTWTWVLFTSCMLILFILPTSFFQKSSCSIPSSFHWPLPTSSSSSELHDFSIVFQLLDQLHLVLDPWAPSKLELSHQLHSAFHQHQKSMTLFLKYFPSLSTPSAVTVTDSFSFFQFHSSNRLHLSSFSSLSSSPFQLSITFHDFKNKSDISLKLPFTLPAYEAHVIRYLALIQQTEQSLTRWLETFQTSFTSFQLEFQTFLTLFQSTHFTSQSPSSSSFFSVPFSDSILVQFFHQVVLFFSFSHWNTQPVDVCPFHQFFSNFQNLHLQHTHQLIQLFDFIEQAHFLRQGLILILENEWKSLRYLPKYLQVRLLDDPFFVSSSKDSLFFSLKDWSSSSIHFQNSSPWVLNQHPNQASSSSSSFSPVSFPFSEIHVPSDPLDENLYMISPKLVSMHSIVKLPYLSLYTMPKLSQLIQSHFQMYPLVYQFLMHQDPLSPLLTQFYSLLTNLLASESIPGSHSFSSWAPSLISIRKNVESMSSSPFLKKTDEVCKRWWPYRQDPHRLVIELELMLTQMTTATKFIKEVLQSR